MVLSCDQTLRIHIICVERLDIQSKPSFEILAGSTIHELKVKICQGWKDPAPVESQVLIYRGRILLDSETILHVVGPDHVLESKLNFHLVIKKALNSSNNGVGSSSDVSSRSSSIPGAVPVSSPNPSAVSGSSSTPGVAPGSSSIPGAATGSSFTPSTAPGSSSIPGAAPGSSFTPSTAPGSSSIPGAAPGSSFSSSTAPGSSSIPGAATGSSFTPSTAPGSSSIPGAATGSSFTPSTAPGSSFSSSTAPGSSSTPSTAPDSSSTPSTSLGNHNGPHHSASSHPVNSGSRVFLNTSHKQKQSSIRISQMTIPSYDYMILQGSEPNEFAFCVSPRYLDDFKMLLTDTNATLSHPNLYVRREKNPPNLLNDILGNSVHGNGYHNGQGENPLPGNIHALADVLQFALPPEVQASLRARAINGNINRMVWQLDLTNVVNYIRNNYRNILFYLRLLLVIELFLIEFGFWTHILVFTMLLSVFIVQRSDFFKRYRDWVRLQWHRIKVSLPHRLPEIPNYGQIMENIQSLRNRIQHDEEQDLRNQTLGDEHLLSMTDNAQLHQPQDHSQSFGAIELEEQERWLQEIQQELSNNSRSRLQTALYACVMFVGSMLPSLHASWAQEESRRRTRIEQLEKARIQLEEKLKGRKRASLSTSTTVSN